MALMLRRGPDVHFRPDGKMLYTVKCASARPSSGGNFADASHGRTYHQGGFLDTSEVHQVIDTKGRPWAEPTRAGHPDLPSCDGGRCCRPCSEIILPGSCPPPSMFKHKERRLS